MPAASHLARHLQQLAAAGSVLGLAACGGQGLTRTGFLSDYDQMRPQPNHTDDAIYVKPGFSPASYTRVIVEPVAWVPSKHEPAREPQTVAMLENTFRADLVRSLSTRFTVIPDPGPSADPGAGVLRVRAAITNTRRALWWINVPAQAADLALGGIGLLRPSVGGASEEMEAVDAHTAKPQVEVATYNNGMPWNVVGSYVAFNHARRAFSMASDLLRSEVAPPVVATAAPPLTGAAPAPAGVRLADRTSG